MIAQHIRKMTVLVVDADQAGQAELGQLLTREGFWVKYAPDASAALASMETCRPDVVLIDAGLPDENSFELCLHLKRDVASRLTPVILMMDADAREDRLRAVETGADVVLTGPVDREELLTRIRLAAMHKRYTDDLDSAASIIMTLASMIEARDSYGDGHCVRMANYATALGRAVGINSADLQTLHRGGFLHDIGMLAIPEAVLHKKGRLEPEEYELIKSHTVIGESLCRNLRSLQAVAPIVRWHHERLDGSGYPDGLIGDAIPLLAQIASIADAFEAVTQSRPYQQMISAEGALDILAREVSRGWRDPDLVRAFVRLVEQGRVGAQFTKSQTLV